jgi:alpha-tubulin suppressor-like RCC1 family protein
LRAPQPVPTFAKLPLRADPAGVNAPLVGGSRQSLAVTSDGALFTWGWNQKWSLGLGHQEGAKTAQRVEALEGVHVVQARCSYAFPLRVLCALAHAPRCAQACWGGWHGLAVTASGEAYAWGGNENMQAGAADAPSDAVPLPARVLPALRVLQVAAGAMHSLALVEGGDVWGWGQPLTTWAPPAGGDSSNLYGKQRAPVRVAGAAGVVRIAAGAFHNLALTGGGHVLAWGNADYGQLGLGSTNHCAEPAVVQELSRAGVTALAAGGWHSAALTAGGVVYVWGRGEHGRLGLGDSWRDRLAPTELPLAARAAAVSLGGTHSCVITEDGTLLSCGRQSFGRLGRSNADNANVPMPVELPPPPPGPAAMPRRWRIEAVSAGGRHTLALARPVPDVPGGSHDAAAVRASSPAPRAPSRRMLGTESARASLSFNADEAAISKSPPKPTAMRPGPPA